MGSSDDWSNEDNLVIANFFKRSHDWTNDEMRRMFYLRQLTIHKAMDEIAPGGADGFLVAISIGLGFIERSPPDVSTVANLTGFSRPKVHRILDLLREKGWVETVSKGGRTLINSTPLGAVEGPRMVSEVIRREQEECSRLIKLFDTTRDLLKTTA